MKKQLGVALLMLCAIMAQAQLMGPGYIMGGRREVLRATPKEYIYMKELLAAAENKDCVAARRILDRDFDINVIAWPIETWRFWPKERSLRGEPVYEIRYNLGSVDTWTEENAFDATRVAMAAIDRDDICILNELAKHNFHWGHGIKTRGRIYDLSGDAYLGRAIFNKKMQSLSFLLSLPKTYFSEAWMKKAHALIEQEETNAAKTQQNAVQREVKASLQKKK